MGWFERVSSSRDTQTLLDSCIGPELDSRDRNHSEEPAAIAGDALTGERSKKMFNAVTIASECGSGGSEIGRKVAELLGWMYVDMELVGRVASTGKVDPSWVEPAGANASAWWERVMNGLPKDGPVTYFDDGPGYETDPDALQQLTVKVIERAAKSGNCVIAGRGAQCILRRHPHVLHALVYAPLADKISRMKLRYPLEHDLHAVLNRIDGEHTRYTHRYYGHDWSNRGLYHLSLNSALGVDVCAKLIALTSQCS